VHDASAEVQVGDLHARAGFSDSPAVERAMHSWEAPLAGISLGFIQWRPPANHHAPN
jgi:hypothetical protein